MANMREIGRGMECVVYDVGDGTVYKDYGCASKAQMVFEMQSIAAEQGLAPAAIECEGTGYYSEMVIMLEKLELCPRDFEDSCEKLIDAIDELFGGQWFDVHMGNFGVFPNGTLCVIDLGPIGFTKTKTGSNLAKKYGLVI